MQPFEFQNATLALSIRSLDHIPLRFHDTSGIIRSLQISREDIYLQCRCQLYGVVAALRWMAADHWDDSTKTGLCALAWCLCDAVRPARCNRINKHIQYVFGKYVYIYVYIYICIYICIYVYVYMYVCMYIYIYLYVYIYISICMYIYKYLFVYIYIYLCMYIHMCIVHM